MTLRVSYQFSGFEDALRKLSGNALLAAPLRQALTRSALLVEGNAKRLVPVDTGNLRRSITYRVDSRPIPLFAQIGTNAPYALVVHEGRRKGAAMPPVIAIEGWLRRRGAGVSRGAGGRFVSNAKANAFVIARAISRRGIKGRPFLRNALEQARGQIQGLLNDAAREIESAWKS